jgi:surface protein
MFASCASLQSLDVSNWDTSNVTSAFSAFANCASLQSLDVSNWDTSNVTNFGSMFASCASLQSLDVSNWDTSNATIVGSMFASCRSLQTLIGGRTIEEVISNNISALNGLKISIPLSNTILDRASLRAIINGLADLTSSSSRNITLGSTLKAKLTEEDIAVATAKNWTIA